MPQYMKMRNSSVCVTFAGAIRPTAKLVFGQFIESETKIITWFEVTNAIIRFMFVQFTCVHHVVEATGENPPRPITDKQIDRQSMIVAVYVLHIFINWRRHALDGHEHIHTARCSGVIRWTCGGEEKWNKKRWSSPVGIAARVCTMIIFVWQPSTIVYVMQLHYIVVVFVSCVAG